MMQVGPVSRKSGAPRLLAIMVVVGAIAGAGYSALSPERWPASVAIQLPQVGTGMALMDPVSVIDRIKVPDFADDVLRAAALTRGKAAEEEATLFRRTLKAEKSRGSDIITVRVQAMSQADAKALAGTVVSILQKEHAADMAKARAFREKALASAETDLAAALETRRQIMTTARSASMPEARLAIFLSANGRDVESLRLRRDELLDQLSPSRTFNTKAIAPISVAAHPLKESMPTCAFIGAAGAALLWGALALLRREEKNPRDSGSSRGDG